MFTRFAKFLLSKKWRNIFRKILHQHIINMKISTSIIGAKLFLYRKVHLENRVMEPCLGILPNHY